MSSDYVLKRCTGIILKFNNDFVMYYCWLSEWPLTAKNIDRIVILKRLQMRKSLHLQRVQRIKRLMAQILEKDQQVLCLRLPAKFHIKPF